MSDVTELRDWRPRERTDVAEPERGEVAAAISKMAVHVVREHVGRGPSRTRTYLRDDLAVVLMRDTFTTAERTLLERGQEDLVLRGREALSAAMCDDLSLGVEALTGRAVLACMSDHDVGHDLAATVFVLGP